MLPPPSAWAANASLREANAALEAFTFVVSHDLKEPVRGLNARLSAFLDEYEPSGMRYAELVRERDARVEMAVPADLTILADPAGRPQVLGNLVANALVHNASKPPRVRVSASKDPTGRVVELVVEDNGEGFPPGLVESFAAGRVPASTRGSGFGLTIARRAVERMGGTITLGPSSALGGAAVRIQLPAHAEAASS